MNKRQFSPSKSPLSKKNEYLFSIDDECSICISSNFESGNIRLVKQLNELSYVLEAVSDVEHLQSKKSWFYFRMQSEKGIRVRTVIKNVNIYDGIDEEKYQARPYRKQGQNGKWQQVKDSVLSQKDELVLIVDHVFSSEEPVYFCLSIPFTYQDQEDYLLKTKAKVHRFIDYQDETVALTTKDRKIHLITVTQRQHTNIKHSRFTIEDKKPIILITSRVHPGEVTSSFCLQGMMEFLLSYNNLQAYLLRRLFIFKIIPMLNPDGVVEGNYRMDLHGNNLNRFYLQPSKDQHPSIYSVIDIVKNVIGKQRIEFYFDLHSHSSFKQTFIYGNALDDIVDQTYSEIFCKVLEENYPLFRYSLCNFGEKQMKHKDKGEQLTKQGCGRVVISKMCGVVQSYTIESCLFPSYYESKQIKPVKHQTKNVLFTYHSSAKDEKYHYEQVFKNKQEDEVLIITQNKKLGKSILISILDMVHKNPYSRLSRDLIQNFSKETSARLLQNEQRFKLFDLKSSQKCRMINQYIRTQIEDKLDRQWFLNGLHNEINLINWPKQFKKIHFKEQALNTNANLKKMRVKTEMREKTSLQIDSNKQKLTKERYSLKKATSFHNREGKDMRSASPKQAYLIELISYPEIRYSLQMKTVENNNDEFKTIQKSNDQQDSARKNHVKSKLIIEGAHDQTRKNTPFQKSFKNINPSLNNIINRKITQQKERKKQMNPKLNKFYHILIENRKKGVPQSKSFHNLEEKIQETLSLEKDHSQSFLASDDALKNLEQKKISLIKRRFLLAKRPFEIKKTTEKLKIRLPDLSRLNLIVENARRDRYYVLHTEEETEN